MNVIVEQVVDEIKIHLLEVAIPFIKEKASEAIDSIKKEFVPMFKELIASFSQSKNVSVEEVELLNQKKLVEIAQKYRVDDCSEVPVYKKTGKDAYYVYLAYSKDRELLPADKNHYVVIKAEGLSRDVEDLFKESELVILK